MRLTAIYNVFDGIELLEGSIKQIHKECFNLLIVYQITSNYGEVDEGVEKFVRRLVLIYDNITLLLFIPDLSQSGSQNERNKRLAGLAAARQLGGSHFLFVDCDEYYMPEEFRWAKNHIILNNYDSTACRLFTYIKHPTYQLTPVENYYVPFISAIDVELCDTYPVYADPTRRTTGNRFYEFKQQELMMHHFSWVRNDIGKKLRNSSAKVNWINDIPDMINKHIDFTPHSLFKYYPGHTILEVENMFGIIEGK
jgi:hypothetical protein